MKKPFQRHAAFMCIALFGTSFAAQAQPQAITPAQVEAVIKEHGITWVQQFEGRKEDHRLGRRFGIEAVPEMWLLDKQGMVVDMHGRHGLEAKVKQLLEND